MKAKAFLSAVLGVCFGFIGYFILLSLRVDSSVQLAVICGLGFGLLLFLFLMIYGNIMEQRYAKLEQEITSPIFYKTNCNFNLGGSKVKNGNVYFCEAGIVCVCLEEKPYTFDQILRQDIDHYQFDNIHLHIFTKDGRIFVLTNPKVANIIEVLRQKGWLE